MYKLHEPNHELRNMSQLAVRLLHVETLAKAQIPEDIENKISHLICHVDAFRPHIAPLLDLSEQVQPSVNVRVNENLRAT
jgi:hypothetical protein